MCKVMAPISSTLHLLLHTQNTTIDQHPYSMLSEGRKVYGTKAIQICITDKSESSLMVLLPYAKAFKQYCSITIDHMGLKIKCGQIIDFIPIFKEAAIYDSDHFEHLDFNA